LIWGGAFDGFDARMDHRGWTVDEFRNVSTDGYLGIETA